MSKTEGSVSADPRLDLLVEQFTELKNLVINNLETNAKAKDVGMSTSVNPQDNGSIIYREDRESIERMQHKRLARIDIQRPATFTGSPSPTRNALWKVFLRQSKLYLKLNAANGVVLDEQIKADLTIQLMVAPAATYAETLLSRMLCKQPIEQFDYEDWLGQLDTFYSKKLYGNTCDKLFDIKQVPGESVDDFFERFSVLLTDLCVDNDPGRDVAVNLFTNALFEVLREKLLYRRRADRILDAFNVNQTEEAVLKCYEVVMAEEAYIISSGRTWLLKPNLKAKQRPNERLSSRNTDQPSRSESSSSRADQNASANQSNNSNARSGAPTSAQKPDRANDLIAKTKCYACGERGHIARFCKKQAKLNVFDPLEDDDSEEELAESAQKNGANVPKK
jgi:hypothetical protein